MQHKAAKEWQIIASVVEQLGYEFVGSELLSSDGHCTLRVYIDSSEGISLDDCVAVSHQLSGVLDVEDPIQTAYDLEVSSPGLDRPLMRMSDFERFVGCQAKLKLSVPLEGRRNFKGVIRGVREGFVVFEFDEQEFELVFEHIEKARLIPEY